jgi:outer membrane protein assembly factor BamA
MKTRLLILALCVVFLSEGRLKAQELSAGQVLFYSTSRPAEAVLSASEVAFTVKEVTISGYKRTRTSTILRELPFREGENYPLPEIIEKLELAKRQLMNTSLFRNVVVTLRSLQGIMFTSPWR